MPEFEYMPPRDPSLRYGPDYRPGEGSGRQVDDGSEEAEDLPRSEETRDLVLDDEGEWQDAADASAAADRDRRELRELVPEAVSDGEDLAPGGIDGTPAGRHRRDWVDWIGALARRYWRWVDRRQARASATQPTPLRSPEGAPSPASERKQRGGRHGNSRGTNKRRPHRGGGGR